MPNRRMQAKSASWIRVVVRLMVLDIRKRMLRLAVVREADNMALELQSLVLLARTKVSVLLAPFTVSAFLAVSTATGFLLMCHF